MPDFSLSPLRGRPIGAMNLTAHGTGGALRPAAPGSLTFDTEGDHTLVVQPGMLPMRIECTGAGALGGEPATGTVGGVGGGGGGYAAGTIPDGLIAYGTPLIIYVGDGGQHGATTYGYAGNVYIHGPPLAEVVLAQGGSGSQGSFAAGSGGGSNPGYPSIVMAGAVDVVLSNGADGSAGAAHLGGDGGTGGGPVGGVGGAGSATNIGAAGTTPGGGGGGVTRTGGAPIGGSGGLARVKVTWPAP